MRTLNLQHPQSLPVWLSVLVWSAAFFSPTAFVLLLMSTSRLQLPAAPGFAVLLFCLIPVAALVACGTVVWRSKMHLRWRLGALIVTVLAMLLQFGVLFVVMVGAITVAISPAQ